MRSIAIAVYSFLLVLIVSCADPEQQKTALGVEEFESGIEKGNVQLLDARTAGEYSSGHLKNALQADWLQKEQFKDRTQYLDKNKPVYLYCLSGTSSGQAADFLRQQGFTEVYNLDGGIVAWKKAGKAVEGVSDKSQMKEEDYAKLVTQSPLVLVDYGAEWCPPCKLMEPVLQKLSADHSQNFTLAKMDGGLEVNLMKLNNVEAIPTLILYKSGKEAWRHQGVMTSEDLWKVIEKFR